MPFPPETPQDHYDYFFGMQGAIHPNPKWEVGLRVARAWLDYCEGDEKARDNQKLISIVRTFMPVRVSGSGFLDLWQNILKHVATLPVSEQKDIWLEVFNSENQGKDTIEHNEEALNILQEWVQLDKSAGTIPINESTMMALVDKMYMYALRSWVWLAFTLSLSEWFKKYIDEPSFYDAVWSKFKKV
jgi:hypothetical protein